MMTMTSRDVTAGRLKGKRSTGRRRYKMLDDLMGNGSYEEMKRKVEDRKLWRRDLYLFRSKYLAITNARMKRTARH